MIKEEAFAKINLFLDVTEKRDDGFHNIRSVMQTITLSDTLYIDAVLSDKTEIQLEIEGNPDLPIGEDNLVYRAVLEYLGYSKIAASVKLVLEKRIPSEAGLAGGSSDAAAALRGMNRIFSKLNEDELLSIALKIGSDVPFLIRGGTSVCEGRGEILTPINEPRDSYIVVSIGKDKISTPRAFAALDARYGDFKTVRSDISTDRFSKFTDELKNGAVSPLYAYNIFEEVSCESAKSVSIIKNELLSSGALLALMSGSGPSVFGVYDDYESALKSSQHIRSLGYAAFVARFKSSI